MLALSIRQPYAELILRGIKTVEYRSRPTRIVGERFWIYAAGKKGPGVRGRGAVKQADNIVVPTKRLPPWMMELAQLLILKDLPTGVIVGSAVIEKVTEGNAGFEWHLGGVERVRTLRRPRGHPQPTWFKPF